MIRNLTISQKFIAIMVSLGVPIMFLLYFLVSTQQVNIDFAQKEIYGDAYLRPLRQLLEHVSQHKALTLLQLKGDPTVTNRLGSLHAQIDEDFKRLSLADQEFSLHINSKEKVMSLKRK